MALIIVKDNRVIDRFRKDQKVTHNLYTIDIVEMNLVAGKVGHLLTCCFKKETISIKRDSSMGSVAPSPIKK
jgi:hypothetical protein